MFQSIHNYLFADFAFRKISYDTVQLVERPNIAQFFTIQVIRWNNTVQYTTYERNDWICI